MAVCLFLAGGAAHGQGPSSYHPRPVSSSTPTLARWTAPPVSGAPVATTIIPIRYQASDSAGEEARKDYKIQLEPPGLERISRLDTDAKLQERIRQETKEVEKSEIVMFPEEPILSREAYYGRGSIWPRRTMFVEPNYVCYERLYFQDINAERYGWDLGPFHPLLSLAKFGYDYALWPAHFAADPCGNDCSAGYCLPGDPTPLLFYPPEVTLRGAVVEIGVILALVAIFP